MSVLEIARRYVAGGLSVVPILADGSKRPAVPWKALQQKRPTDAELVRWFGPEKHGLAIICGQVAGNLEVLDFDDGEACFAWRDLVEAELPGLLGKLPVVSTPRGGFHVYYRLRNRPPGNQKLALRRGKETLIETRGEGGYVLAPGCPAACHPSGGLYVQVSGPALPAVPQIEQVPLA